MNGSILKAVFGNHFCNSSIASYMVRPHLSPSGGESFMLISCHLSKIVAAEEPVVTDRKMQFYPIVQLRLRGS